MLWNTNHVSLLSHRCDAETYLEPFDTFNKALRKYFKVPVAVIMKYTDSRNVTLRSFDIPVFPVRPMNVEAAKVSETSVICYQISLCYVTEASSLMGSVRFLHCVVHHIL
jgi:hypothetical protein